LQTRSCIPKKTSFPLGKSIKIKNPPPAGHYSFTYTPSFAGPTWTTSFAFNSNSSSTHTFLIDNISMCPINAVQPITSYSADILMHTDYYAFGQQQPGRTWQGTAEGYRYSHNSHEKEDALFKGAQSAEYWMYDSRIGRRWNLDPLTYDWQSPYASFNNCPVYFADPLGLQGKGGDDKSKGGNDKNYGGKCKCSRCNGGGSAKSDGAGSAPPPAATTAGSTPSPQKQGPTGEQPQEVFNMNETKKAEAKTAVLLSASNMNTQNGMYPGGKPTLPNRLSYVPFDDGNPMVTVSREVSKNVSASVNTDGDFSAEVEYKSKYWTTGGTVTQNINGKTTVDPKVKFDNSKLFLPEMGIGGDRTVVYYSYVVKDNNFAVMTQNNGLQSCPTRTVNGIAIAGKLVMGPYTAVHYSKYEMVQYSIGFSEGPYKVLDSTDASISAPIKFKSKNVNLDLNIKVSK